MPAPALDRIAVLYLRPKDITTNESLLYSESELQEHYLGNGSPLRAFWNEVSHGKYRYSGTVFRPAPLPVTIGSLVATGKSYVADALQQALGPSGIPVPGLDLDHFDFVFVLLAWKPADYTYNKFGAGYIEGDVTVNGKTKRIHYFSTLFQKEVNGYWFAAPDGRPFTGIQDHGRVEHPELRLWDEDSTLLHEWGHRLGCYGHAHFLRVEREPMQGRVAVSYGKLGDDYGDYFDIMGNGRLSMHLNAVYQEKLGWLGPDNVTRIDRTTLGVRLTPLEGGGTVRAVTIKPPRPPELELAPENAQHARRLAAICGDASFSVEYRQPVGFDVHLGADDLVTNTRGVLVRLAMPSLGSSELGSWLLDMSPEVASAPLTTRYDDHRQAALVDGRRFYDPTSQVMITGVRSDAGNGVTFDVVLGEQPGVPAGVSAEPDRSLEAWVTDYSSSFLRRIDLSRATLDPARTAVDDRPSGIALTPDGRSAYTANYGSRTVSAVTLASGEERTRIPVGDGPTHVAMSKDGRTAYAVNSRDGSITPIATATDTPEKPITLPGPAVTMVIAPSGATAYALTFRKDPTEQGLLVPIDLATRTPGKPVDLNGCPFDLVITPDGRTAYVACRVGESDRGVVQVDVTSGTVSAPIPLEDARSITITPDGRTLYAVCPRNDQPGVIFPIPLATKVPAAPIAVGVAPAFITMSPGGTTVYVGCMGKVIPIDTRTGTVRAPIAVSDIVAGMAIREVRTAP